MHDLPKFRMGLGSRAFPWASGRAEGPGPKKRMDPLDFITTAREMGMDRIQITDDMPLEYLPWEALIRLKRYAGAQEMEVTIGTRGLDIDHYMKFLEIAVFLKSPTLLVRPFVHGKEIPSIGNIREILKILLPEFEKETVQILIENQPPYGIEDYKGLLREIDHPQLGMSLDPGILLKSGGNPEQLLETLGPWCVNLYYSDWNRPKPELHESASGSIAGKGDLSLIRLLNTLGKYRQQVDVYMGLEVPWQESLKETLALERKWVLESLAYLRNPS